MAVTVIDIRELTKVFSMGVFKRAVKALDGISISVSEGEIFGFLGPNGAGKTTTLKIMMGLNRPTAGTITIFEKDHADPRVRENLGYLPEQPYFYDYLTANEFLTFYGNLFGLKRRAMKEKARSLLELVGLEGAGDLALRKFSKGMLQRIGIAQALINDPRLVVLDEPMSGLDPIGRREMRDLILRLKHEGKTVFFSSHIISDVEMICDRVAILHKGKIMAQGKIDDLLRSPKTASEVELAGLDGKGGELFGSLATVLAETSGRVLIRIDSADDVEKILEIARTHGGKLVSLIPHKQSLEDLFTEKVGGGGE